MLETESNLILKPSPLQWHTEKGKESGQEQREFPFMDETPPTKVLPFMVEKGKEN